MILTEAAKIVFEICLAIEFLHSHDIAHRDLKVFLLVNYRFRSAI